MIDDQSGHTVACRRVEDRDELGFAVGDASVEQCGPGVVEHDGMMELLADIETDPDLNLSGCGHGNPPCRVVPPGRSGGQRRKIRVAHVPSSTLRMSDLAHVPIGGLCARRRRWQHPPGRRATGGREPCRQHRIFHERSLAYRSSSLNGWCIDTTETAAIAEKLITATAAREKLDRHQLIIHSDRGAQMTSGTLTELYDALGVRRSLSRPRVFDDNPHAEAGFKTLKYRPDWPARFATPAAAIAHCEQFFGWYNDEHHSLGDRELSRDVA